jgi:oxygen-independent coproporphyrinogen-3 oxidase
MDPQLLERFDKQVPRYTSYPTAPHFHAKVTAANYRDWLTNIGEAAPVSLYLHVPFCTQMCWYCACHTKVVRQYGPVRDYAALLAGEITLVGSAIPTRPRVTHVHWGGGSPNILSGEDFLALMALLREHFCIADDAEIAVEIDPRNMTECNAMALADAGVNRASLGVQDFNENVQRAINRVQSYEMTAQVVAWLRTVGIEAINFDLMYGLPHQSVEDVVRTVDLAVSLAPDRFAVFGYAHVPWMKRHQRMIEEAALPGGAERLAQAEAAATRLVEWGYRRIGLDHFARLDDPLTRALDAGRLKRNFQGYTTDQAKTLLGFGASAIGSLTEGYVQNAVPVRTYADAIRKGQPAVTRGRRVDAADLLRRTVIERLMCDLAVDLDAVSAAFGAPKDEFTIELSRLAPMERDGLVEVDGDRIRVRESARPLLRSVCAVFDRYLNTDENRHSRAV